MFIKAWSGQLDIKKGTNTHGKVTDTVRNCDCHGNIQSRVHVAQHCRRVGRWGALTDVPYTYIVRD